MASLFDGLNAKELTPENLALLNKLFSKVQGGGALESAYQPPAAPAPAPTEIPKLEAMPVGQGSWFNRPFTAPSVQAAQRREMAKTTAEEKEGAAVQDAKLKYPEKYGDAPDFGTMKELMNWYSLNQKVIPARKKLAETERANRAKEEAARNKNKSPFGKPGKTQVAGGKTAKDVLNKFGL